VNAAAPPGVSQSVCRWPLHARNASAQSQARVPQAGTWGKLLSVRRTAHCTSADPSATGAMEADVSAAVQSNSAMSSPPPLKRQTHGDLARQLPILIPET